MRTRRETVHSALREKILRRELAPGERLIERELAAELGVSRTPVRECLVLLELEGLADPHPGLGVVVREITVREVREALAVRSALDGLAAREAARGRDEEDLAVLEASLRVQTRAVRAGDEDGIMRADSQFHARIYQAARNGVLAGLQSTFALYESFYFHADFYQWTASSFARSLKRHRQMLQSIAEADPDGAERTARLHVEEATELLREPGVCPPARSEVTGRSQGGR